VSQGCKHCYAEQLMDTRYHKVKWGPEGKRIRTSPANWKKPLKWDMTWWVECEVCGLRQVFNQFGRCPDCEHPMVATMKRARQRVFCASLADVFELKEDQKQEMDLWRADLFDLIEKTPNLDWLLLTKRPENIGLMIPWDGLEKRIPTNIWWGFSAENQEEFDKRVPIMESFSRLYHQTYFVSIEPMLGKIDISDWLDEFDIGDEEGSCWSSPIDWVICGGESGPGARPLHPDWVRSLRDQCVEADVPFLFKQWGEYLPVGGPEHYAFKKLGKNRTGRILEGQEWRQFPT
jgi:protein gp37